MSWLPVPVPVLKSDEATLAVQPRSVAERVSDTVTVPSEPETEDAPTEAVPKLTASGVVMDSDPVATVNVTVVGPVLAPAAAAADAVTAAGASANASASRTSSGLGKVSPEVARLTRMEVPGRGAIPRQCRAPGRVRRPSRCWRRGR